MQAVPAIAPTIMVWERRFQAFQRNVSTTHDGLTHVIEAMDHMPVVIFRERSVARESGVDLHDRVEAVKLVRHRGREDGTCGVGPDYGCREGVVGCGVGDVLEAHAD